MAASARWLLARTKGLTPERLHWAPALALEGLWLYPWMLWISSRDVVTWRDPPLGLPSTFLLLFTSYLSTRHERWRASVPAAALLLLANLALAAFLLRVEQGGGFALTDPSWGAFARAHLQKLVAGGLYALYLIWRGASVGREELTPDRAGRTFLFGFLALALLLVVWAAGSFEPVGATIAGYVSAFFFSGLMALALANIAALNAETARLGTEPQRMGNRWLTVAAGLGLVLIVAALALASIVSLDFVTYVGHPVAAVARGLFTAVLYGVVLPLGAVIASVIFAVQWFVDLIRGGQPAPKFKPPDPSQLRELSRGNEGFNVPSEIVAAARWGSLAIAVTIVLVIVLRTFLRRRQARRQAEVDEVSESLWSWARFWADLRGWLLGLFGSLRRRRRVLAGLTVPVAARLRRDDGRELDVREIYRRLLVEAALAGTPRREHETPWEYASRLRGVAPAGEVREITDDYVHSRYGRLEPPSERLRALNQLWRRLRDALRGT